MENCSQIKLGIQGLTTQVASRDMTPRSKGQGHNVTLRIWVKIAVTRQYWVVE